MAIVKSDERVTIVMDYEGTTNKTSYPAASEATAETMMAAAQAINILQAHPLKDVFRKVTVRLVNQ